MHTYTLFISVALRSVAQVHSSSSSRLLPDGEQWLPMHTDLTLLLKHLTSGHCNVVLIGTVLHHANMLPLANNATSAAAQASLPDSSCHVSKTCPTADWTPCLSRHACLLQHCTSMALHELCNTLCSMVNLSIPLYMLVAAVFSSIWLPHIDADLLLILCTFCSPYRRSLRQAL